MPENPYEYTGPADPVSKQNKRRGLKSPMGFHKPSC